ncbi:MAG: ribosome-binding factor A [Acidobacteria bacterium RIFCSPLOWO2_02_FULL_61_28]|nr:MAG: ribosome-binding factor A [Acidobacteria bacterium RIFCSPLOWO2_02_FULL_61_28]
MRARTHRVERLADLIRQELTELIEYEVKDPRVGLASVTAVDLSENLRRVRVLVRVPGDDPQRETSLVGLEAAEGFLRRELAHRLALRHTPAISFYLDQTQRDEQSEPRPQGSGGRSSGS